MRKIKLFISALVIFVANFFFVPNANALDSIKTTGYDYIIDEYHVDISVNENNTYDIKEEISVTFYNERHGIFRLLPLYNTVERQDGSKSKNRARITNISVSDNYTTEYENGYMKLKIGDRDKLLTGKKKYTIKYNYNIGKDPLEGKDEFYYDIIGTKWDTKIANVSFMIRMPKEFDSETIGFSAGTLGSTGTDNLIYHVIGKDIYGQYMDTLPAGSGLTIRFELPEGYYVGAGIEISKMVYVAYAFPIVALIIIARLWAKYGKDKKIFIKPEYYPPEGKNSLEVGFLYKGSASSKDVLSLLIYLANKGYLTIKETEEKGFLSKKKGFELTKVKDYNGKDENEKLFFNGLFKGGKTTVTSKDLYDKFYKTTTKIITNVNKKENREKIFEKRGWIIFFSILLIIASFILITVPPFMDYGDYETMIIAVMFPGIGLAVMVAGIANIFSRTSSASGSIFTFGFLILWGVMFGGIPFLALVLPEILLDNTYAIGYLVGLVCIVGQVILVTILPKRTDYGLEMFAAVQGFKDFLKMVEKERLEQMVNENPNYFFDILPYTYVLGVSDKWIKKFESMNLKAPDWYSGNISTFDAMAFNSFMNSTMSAANASMSSTASHSSGSGGGGGGFSGGGSGGGGGGSW